MHELQPHHIARHSRQRPYSARRATTHLPALVLAILFLAMIATLIAVDLADPDLGSYLGSRAEATAIELR